MKNKEHENFFFDCKQIGSTIEEMINKYLPTDAFCEQNRESFIKDIDSNILIKHSSSAVCIIEYSTSNYVYVSENIRNEVNVTAAELIENGLGRAFKEFTENQRKVTLEEIYPAIFQHYGEYAAKGEAQNIHVIYNTLLKAPNGEMKWFLHQLTVLACDEKGFPRYGLKFLSNIDAHKNDDVQNMVIQKINPGKQPELIYSKDFYPHYADDTFSIREKEIMDLVVSGYTSKTIAEKLNISMNTVSTHRRNIARKQNGDLTLS